MPVRVSFRIRIVEKRSDSLIIIFDYLWKRNLEKAYRKKRKIMEKQFNSLKSAQWFQRQTFNKSFSEGPFIGAVAELSYVKRTEFALRFALPSFRVLDIGCGDGTVTKRIASRVKEVVALDISEKAIEVANRFNPDPRIEYLKSPVEEYSQNKPFNMVLMFEVVEHLYSPGDILAQAYTLLDKKGVIIISTPNFMRLTRRIKLAWPVRPIRRALGKNSLRINIDHIKEYTCGELKDLLAKHSFKVLAREGAVIWTNTVGGDLFRDYLPLQRLNFNMGSLFPQVAGCMFIAAQKV